MELTTVTVKIEDEAAAAKQGKSTYEGEIKLPSFMYDERGIYYGLEKLPSGKYAHSVLAWTAEDKMYQYRELPYVTEENYVFHHSDETTDLVRLTQEDFKQEVRRFFNHFLTLTK